MCLSFRKEKRKSREGPVFRNDFSDIVFVWLTGISLEIPKIPVVHTRIFASYIPYLTFSPSPPTP